MKYFIGLCILTCSMVPAFATTIDFSNPLGDRGTSQAYGVVTATSYGTNSPHLYGKNQGAGETGVGLTTDPSGEHEIIPGGFIQLDLTNLLGLSLSITMDSVTGSEAYSVFASSSALATSGTAVTHVGNTFTVTPTLKYLDFTASSGNVLLSSLTYTPASTPEPISLALTGSGLVGLFLLRRRRAGSR